MEINTTTAQQKAMAYIAVDPQKWIQNAWDNRARQATDQIILEKTDRQPTKISRPEKEQLVLAADIKSAADRQAELNAARK